MQSTPRGSPVSGFVPRASNTGPTPGNPLHPSPPGWPPPPSPPKPQDLAGPMILRTTDAGRSDWPTWTPSASTAKAMSRRSFTMKGICASRVSFRSCSASGKAGRSRPPCHAAEGRRLPRDGRFGDLVRVRPRLVFRSVRTWSLHRPGAMYPVIAGQPPCDAAFPKAAQKGSTLGWFSSRDVPFSK